VTISRGQSFTTKRDERTEAAVDSSGKEKGLGWSFVTISRGQSFTTMRNEVHRAKRRDWAGYCNKQAGDNRLQQCVMKGQKQQ
jgi:hypothetical protein